MSEQPKITVIHQPASQKEVGCNTVIVEAAFIGAILIFFIFLDYWLN